MHSFTIHESRNLKQARPKGQYVDLLRYTLATPSWDFMDDTLSLSMSFVKLFKPDALSMKFEFTVARMIKIISFYHTDFLRPILSHSPPNLHMNFCTSFALFSPFAGIFRCRIIFPSLCSFRPSLPSRFPSPSHTPSR